MTRTCGHLLRRLLRDGAVKPHASAEAPAHQHAHRQSRRLPEDDLGYSVVPFEEDTSYPSFIATKLHPASPLHPPTAEGLNLGGTGFSGMAICDDKSGSFPAPWQQLLAHPSPDMRREAVRALSSLRVPEGVAFTLLQPLAGEPAWTVRYEVLRFFRRAAGPVNPAHLAWLRPWTEGLAPETKVNGWNGSYLALGGSYERAFQNFLFTLAETKTGAALVAESKWDRTLATEPAATAGQTALLTKRHAAVKAALPAAKAEDGRALVGSLCLTCHSIAGKGAGFAPPLDGSASRDLDGLIRAIVAPNEAAENIFRLYRVEKKDGAIVEGFKRNEDAQEITVVLMGGAAVAVPIGEVKAAGYIPGRSVMPDLTGGMTEAQVAAIAAFLRTVK